MRDPRRYKLVILDGVHRVNGRPVAVTADHDEGVITVARGAPVDQVVMGLVTAMNSAYARCGFCLVPVLGVIASQG